MGVNIKNYLGIENKINELFFIYDKDNKKNYFIREQIFLLFYKNIICRIVSKLKYYPRCLEKIDLIHEGILIMDDILLNYVYTKYKCDFVTFAKGKIKQKIDKLIRLSHYPSTPIRVYNKNKKNKRPNQDIELFSSNENIENRIVTKYEYEPYFPKMLNPHQEYIKKLNFEIFLHKMHKKLNKMEYQVLMYSYGIPKTIINNIYYGCFLADFEISSRLNITRKQIYKYREKAILKLKT
ncbi:MAG: sigma-70 family RNA polymerase sigma factor [Phytoplasma sp.]|uniref:sigma-70 family RNA polymerase sigma factor n=1 Tax=Phytoplasma sp. TaxID=2155 RepID=UPI002B412576|nr:sigma-70 family RNA polymerase sigma factor [Phytoplasma sp.]WRH06571.1 MAG: sigma-70 family RNA polymerase sigma factor [Phytoplasma sp.]